MKALFLAVARDVPESVAFGAVWRDGVATLSQHGKTREEAEQLTLAFMLGSLVRKKVKAQAPVQPHEPN